jgi:hypothetical protein
LEPMATFWTFFPSTRLPPNPCLQHTDTMHVGVCAHTHTHTHTPYSNSYTLYEIFLWPGGGRLFLRILLDHW